MKKTLLAIMLCMPLLMTAQSKSDPKYLAGAVPEENGIVIFRESFSVTGKSREQVFQTMSRFVEDYILGNAFQGLYTRLVSDGKDDGTIVAKAEEFFVFKKKPLYLDRTRFRYQFSAEVQDNKVNMTVTRITYYYNEDMDGNNGINYKAEEWITDSKALNKSKTKLYPKSHKFRIRTIDRIEEIFNAAKDACK